MDKYLTTKAKPGRLVRLAENAAALTLAAALFCWGFIAVMGFLQDGFMPLAHTLMVLVAIPFTLLLSWLLERKRARKHAQVIVSALCLTAEGCIACDELEKITGVRQLRMVIARLTAKGLVKDIAVMRDLVRLTDREIPQGRCAMCGAALVSRGDGAMHCPYCGSSTAA